MEATDSDTLESSNRILGDIERKLSLTSLTSSTYTAQSHDSVVKNPSYSGLARQNIQSSVLRYIRDNGSDFDADRVYSDRHQKFATSFAREYSPASSKRSLSDDSTKAPSGQVGDNNSGSHNNLASIRHPSESSAYSVDENSDSVADYANDYTNDYFDDLNSSEDDYDHETRALGDEDEFNGDYHDDFYDDAYDDDYEAAASHSDDDDELLPPSPPRSPPKEMDPNKLYGLYDFSGPDPSHCTLVRDEPVYLVNDSDNYWWLIKKLTKQERRALWLGRGLNEEIVSDDEDGKIGFVPAECLETYGERLARLNCFKNEELERSSRETLPNSESVTIPNSIESFEQTITGGSPSCPENVSYTFAVSTEEDVKSVGTLGRSSSILKKTRSYGQNNKSVTFENLGDIKLEEEYDEPVQVVDFSDHYFSFSQEDVPKANLAVPENPGEVLSDMGVADEPINITKTLRKSQQDTLVGGSFEKPVLKFTEDNGSIGSFSPDTPPTLHFESNASRTDKEDEENRFRRSIILDRLNRVTSEMQGYASEECDVYSEPEFGGQLSRRDRTNSENSAESANSDYEQDFKQYHNSLSHEKGVTGHHRVHELTNIDDEESGLNIHTTHKSPSGDVVNTPLTSVNSLGCVGESPGGDKDDGEQDEPFQNMFLPIMGKLDELTEKLAELTQTL